MLIDVFISHMLNVVASPRVVIFSNFFKGPFFKCFVVQLER